MHPGFEAAAMLHDVGYSVDQLDHARESAEIILHTPLRGFMDDHRRIIALTVALHRRNIKKVPVDRYCTDEHGVTSSFHLASLLRIADGLDHSHLQNTVIENVECSAASIICHVKDSSGGVNIIYAIKKADVWNSTFPAPVQFKVNSVKGAFRFSGVVGGGDSKKEYMRRILYSQFRKATDVVPELWGDDSVEALHDLRVALRRLRSALVVFRPVIDNNPLRKKCIAVIRDFSREAGSYRDTDVWFESIRRFEKRKNFVPDAEWKLFTDKAQAIASGKVPEDIFSRTSLGEMFADLARFLRTDIGCMEYTPEKEALLSFAKKRVNRSAAKVYASFGDYRTWSVGEYHSFRRQCRKTRYICEFFAPLLGKNVNMWARRFEAIAENLGTIHDIDVYLSEQNRPGLPDVYRRYLSNRCRDKIRLMKNHAQWIRELKKKIC
jgi:CHAD domain-containing protein